MAAVGRYGKLSIMAMSWHLAADAPTSAFGREGEFAVKPVTGHPQNSTFCQDRLSGRIDNRRSRRIAVTRSCETRCLSNTRSVQKALPDLILFENLARPVLPAPAARKVRGRA